MEAAWMSHVPEIFDRRQLVRQRMRWRALSAEVDFLRVGLADRLADRVLDVKRDFPLALDLGSQHGQLADRLLQSGKVGRCVRSDAAPAFLAPLPSPRVACDEEALPFVPASFDLIASSMTLHHLNDLPGALSQLHAMLKPDGLLVANFLGGQSLKEWREGLTEAEIAVSGGASPRIAPMIEVRDAGALLQRAGFAMPVADSEILTLRYIDPLRFLYEWRAMGEGNALMARRRHFTPRMVFLKAISDYVIQRREEDGRVPVTLEIITLTGWKPDASQPQPLAPGSGKTSLSEALS